VELSVNIIPTWDLSEEEWLAERAKGIGGSDAGTILGLNQYGSSFQLWSEKAGKTVREFTGNEATEWGHRLEPVIGEAYAQKFNKALVEWPVLAWSSSPDYPFMFVNLDYVEVEPSEQFPAGKVTVWHSTEIPPGIIDIVEVKTTGIATNGAANKWAKGKVPETYLIQGYHYGIVLASLGIEVYHVTFAALVGGQGLVVRKLGKLPDDDLIWDDKVALDICEAESAFWANVVYEIEPEIDGSDTTEELISARFPRSTPDKVLDMDDDDYLMVQNFVAAKEETKKATEREKALRTKIVSRLGDHEAAVYSNELVLTFKSGQDRTTFDAKSLEASEPEVWSRYLKSSPGSRTLLVK
jgi:putative phage-type endonuclease